MKTVTTRGSFGETLGTPFVNVNVFHRFGCVQVGGFWLPRIRWFMPFATWFCLFPVAGGVQSCGEALSGHVSVGLTAHVPAQPLASVSANVLPPLAALQLTDWFWLPVPSKRITYVGSDTDCALPRLPAIPIVTVSLGVQASPWLPVSHKRNESASRG